MKRPPSDAFMSIHLVLHLVLRSHPYNTFHSLLSEVCIYGAGLVGLLHGALLFRAHGLRGPWVEPHSR
jgi:threonine dehydrogenase-like Zn-dependent dehydrogenase